MHECRADDLRFPRMNARSPAQAISIANLNGRVRFLDDRDGMMLTALETANNQSDTPSSVKVRPHSTNLVPSAHKSLATSYCEVRPGKGVVVCQ